MRGLGTREEARSGASRGLGRLARAIWPYLAATLLVHVTVAVVQALAPIAWVPHISVLFLGCVLGAAVPWGVGPSLLAVILAMAASAFFFFPPIHSFMVDHPQDLVDLSAFGILAVVLSQQTARIRRQAAEARTRERRISDLYAFSHRIAGLVDREELGHAILDGLRSTFGSPLALIKLTEDGDRYVIKDPGAAPTPVILAAADRMLETGPSVHEFVAEGDTTRHLYPLKTGERIVAVLVGADSSILDSAAKAGLDASALLDHAAVAIELGRLARSLEAARVQARADELREVLVNSVSHDLKTPLTSIIGSVTALKEFWRRYDEAVRIDLVDTIYEEAIRLGHVVGNALDLARLRSGEMTLRREVTEMADVVNAAIADVSRVAPGRTIDVRLPDDLPMLEIDPFLAERALVQILENATKYSPAETPVTVVARSTASAVTVEISDAGIGFAPEEAVQVFERFYRGAGDDSATAGAGLGLAIARAFVRANGGTIEAASPGRGRGATFRVAYPVSTSVPERGVA